MLNSWKKMDALYFDRGRNATYFVLLIISILIDTVHMLAVSGKTVMNSTSATVNSTTLPITVIANCKDKNWKFHKSKCYRVFNTFEYFSSASKICKDNGAELATIVDSIENKIVEDLVKGNTRYAEAWLGLRREQSSNEYTWVDNSKHLYRNWLFQRPNNDGDCVEIIPGGYWSNTFCYRKLQFVCKKDEVSPVQKDNKTKLIIMITLPFSCVVIMLVFITYLCLRTHEEMKSIRLEEKKISQHFVDVVANNEAVQAEKNDVVQAYEDHLKEKTRKIVKEQALEERHLERRKQSQSSLNGKEKMYKQVTFV